MVGDADLVEIVPAADARLIVLMAENMIPRPGEDARESVSDGLETLTGFSADLDGVFHGAVPFEEMKLHKPGRFAVSSVTAARSGDAEQIKKTPQTMGKLVPVLQFLNPERTVSDEL